MRAQTRGRAEILRVKIKINMPRCKEALSYVEIRSDMTLAVFLYISLKSSVNKLI